MFQSIQGEGAHVGVYTTFVRFQGCNMSCPWCDTPDACSWEGTAEQLRNLVKTSCSRKVGEPLCFTGGEPLLQLDEELILQFRDMGPLHLETNGTIEPPSPGEFECITVSPKGPLNEMDGRGGSFYATYNSLSDRCDLKVVMDVKNPWLVDILYSWGSLPFRHKFLQPCMGVSFKRRSMEEALRYVKIWPEWRLSVQVHKMLGLK